MASYSLQTRRQDSVGLLFSFIPNQKQISEVIFEDLKIKYDEIIGFQPLNRHKVVIQFDKSYAYHSFCDKYDEKDIDIGNGKSVRVVNLSRQYTYVSIRYAPFNMENAVLEGILKNYGKVYGIRLNRYAHGKEEGLLNGTRTARMELKRGIPSSMTIHGFNIVFYYNGQMKTCYKCGRESHMAAECMYEVEDRINVFNVTEFPEIPGKKRNADDEGNKDSIETTQKTQEKEEHGKNVSEKQRSEDETQQVPTIKEPDMREIPRGETEFIGKPISLETPINQEEVSKEGNSVNNKEGNSANNEEGNETEKVTKEVTVEIHKEDMKTGDTQGFSQASTTEEAEIHKEDKKTGDTQGFSQASPTEEDTAMCQALEIYTEQQKNAEMEIVEETSESEKESCSTDTDEELITDSLEDEDKNSEGDQWQVKVKNGCKLKIRKSKNRKSSRVKRRKFV